MSLTELVRILEMSIPGVGFAEERGAVIAHDNEYKLIELDNYFFKSVPIYKETSKKCISEKPAGGGGSKNRSSQPERSS